MELQTWNIRVTGKVQGVFFRQSTMEKAKSLGITGWVRNIPDGSVEIMASGTVDQLTALFNWCHEGPEDAAVESAVKKECAYSEFKEFFIQR